MDTKPVTPFPMAAGQIVYVVLLGHVLPFVISEITFSADSRSPIATADHGIGLKYLFNRDAIGKTVFDKRTDAEAALAKQ